LKGGFVAEVYRNDLRKSLAHTRERGADYPAERFSGRGLVVCAGGPRMLTNAYVLMRLLRERLDCSLPTEIWHLGPREMPQLLADQLLQLECRVIDAVAVREAFPADIHDGWQLKAYALLNSAFEQVLMLDADQVPVVNPAAVFDWPQFRETGAVFWPDIIDLSADNPVWDLLDLPLRQVRSWESGQLCVDKRKHWRALNVLLCLVEHADRLYQLIYGDKDAFLIAWTLEAAKHALVPHPPMIDPKFLGQRDFAGDLIFQHRTNCKWSLHETPERPEHFVWQAECEAYLDDLRAIWDERIFEPPPRSQGARRLERRLTAERRFSMTLGADDPQPIELLAGHQIGVGRSYRVCNWHVEDAAGAYELVLHDRAKPSFRLRCSGDGLWEGHATAQMHEAVVLEAVHRPAAGGQGEPADYGLADEILQVALRGVPSAPLDAAGLAAALKLVARLESGTAEAVIRHAQRLTATDSEAARQLRKIGEELAQLERENVVRPVPRDVGILSRYYVRP
jgi:hypothetical protein